MRAYWTPFLKESPTRLKTFHSANQGHPMVNCGSGGAMTTATWSWWGTWPFFHLLAGGNMQLDLTQRRMWLSVRCSNWAIAVAHWKYWNALQRLFIVGDYFASRTIYMHTDRMAMDCAWNRFDQTCTVNSKTWLHSISTTMSQDDRTPKQFPLKICCIWFLG